MSVKEYKKQLYEAYVDGEWDIPLIQVALTRAEGSNEVHQFAQAVEAVAFELQDPSVRENVTKATTLLPRSKRGEATAGQ